MTQTIRPIPMATKNEVLAALDQHTPDMTDEDELEIDSRNAHQFENGVLEWADYALRTCACGKRIDGFYEYVDHLKEVIRAL